MLGVPNIAGFIPPSSIANAAIGLGGAALIRGIFGKTWGVVNQFGIPIILADNVVSMNYDAGASISKYPVESGKFASYNKVNNPSMATVTMSKGGDSAMSRSLFLTQLELLLKSTLSFHIITPEYVYMNYQIIGINHARSASDGATLITVNLDLEEVLEAKIEYDIEEVKNPSDSNTIDGGPKQSTQRTSILADIVGN